VIAACWWGFISFTIYPGCDTLEKIARSDVFIVLDNVQFTKNDWQNRNRVKTSAGSTVLTDPFSRSWASHLTPFV
jgi:hypothetical protein